MIVVSGEITLAAESVEAAKEAAVRMAAETRGEAGCRSYAFFQSIEDPTRFRVFEEWDSEEALAAHFETPHMKEWRATLAQLEITGRDIRKYTVSEVAEL